MSPTEVNAPKLTSLQRKCFYAAYVAIAAAGTYYLRLSEVSLHAGKYFAEVSKGGDWKFPGTEVILRRTYSGIGPVDGFLSFLVAAFMPAASGWTPGQLLQLIYFLLSFTPFVAISSIESVRSRNVGGLITYTSIWAFLYQTVGGAIIIPLWFAFYTWKSADPAYFSRSREVPAAKVRTLLPALVFGYIIPTCAFAYPFNLKARENLEATQVVTAFWQVAPILVNVVWLPLSYMVGSEKSSNRTRSNSDRSYLMAVHGVSFVVSLVAHLATLYICLTSDEPTLSLDFVFIPNRSGPPSLRSSLMFFFQVDFILIFAASLLWCFQVKLELINANRAPFGIVYAALSTLIGSVILGPGAVMSAVIGWREFQIDDVSHNRKTR